MTILAPDEKTPASFRNPKTAKELRDQVKAILRLSEKAK
jgi:hypothetical protein